MNLTEQWDKGELPEGDYYIKRRNGDTLYDNIDSHGVWRNSIDEDIVEVLAEMPDYVEWRNMVSCACEEHEENNRLIEENAKLKELLKECYVAINEGTFQDLCEMLHKISQVLGEE